MSLEEKVSSYGAVYGIKDAINTRNCMKYFVENRRFTIGKTMLTLEQPASLEAVIGLGACAFVGHTGTRDCFSCHAELLAARTAHIEAAVEVCNFGA